MTKAKLTELYKNWNRKVGKAYFEDTTLEELKELCVEFGDGNRWCSWQICLEKIILGGNSRAITRAFMLYEKHNKIEANWYTLAEIAKATNNCES